MVKTMTRAQAIPHFGYSDEINMTELVNLRKYFSKLAADRGIKFSYMPVCMKVKCLDLILFFNILVILSWW